MLDTKHIQELVGHLSDGSGRRGVAMVTLCTAATIETNAQAIVEAGAIIPLIRLLRRLDDSDEHVRILTVLTLYTICHNNDQRAFKLTRAGAIPVLIELLSKIDLASPSSAIERSVGYRGTVAEILGELSIIKDNAVVIVQAGVVDKLLVLMKDDDERVRVRAARALKNTAFCEKCVVSIAASAETIPFLIDRIRCDSDIRALLLGTLCNLTSNLDCQADIVRAGGIPILITCVRDQQEKVRNEAQAVLYNLANNPTDMAQEVVDAIAENGLTVPQLYDMMHKGRPGHFVKRVAEWDE